MRTDLRHDDGRLLSVYGEHGSADLPTFGAGEPSQLHLRHDALTDTWVGVSPARNSRPLTSTPATAASSCPLCPGGPEIPFGYEAAVFENRFPTLVADAPTPPPGPTAPSTGRCEVVLYTSEHVGSLGTLTGEQLARVVAIWADRSGALWADPAHRHVLVFENRGEDVGATLSHPHGQIYAFGHLPPFIAGRLDALAKHRAEHDTCLTCGVVADDDGAPDRQVAQNASFTINVPYAARWPYEVHVRARRHGLSRLGDLTTDERRDLAEALRTVVHAYDALYDRPLHYMMTCMEAPSVDGAPAADWHLAFEFAPPARAADRLKIRASVETATGLFINDTLPELTATHLADALTSAGGVPDLTIPDVIITHGLQEPDHTRPARVTTPTASTHANTGARS